METPTESETSTPISAQLSIVAILVSILGIGLGQFVLGHPGRGLKWCFARVAMQVCFVAAVFAGAGYVVWPFFAASVLLWLVAIADTLWIRTQVVRWSNLKVALAVVGVFVVQQTLGEAVVRLVHFDNAPTAAMYPTIQVGDHFMSSLTLDQARRGDVITFEKPADQGVHYVSRVAAIGGDTVEVRDGRLVLNGRPADVEATRERCEVSNRMCTIWRETIEGRTYRIALFDGDDLRLALGRDFGPQVVPAGHVFLLGDSRDNSQDSRFLGSIPQDRMVRRPRLVYWSSDESGTRWSRINQPIE